MADIAAGNKVAIKNSFFKLRTLIGFIIGAIVIYIFLKNFHLKSALNAIADANWLWLFLSIIIFYISLPLRAARWRLLLNPTGFSASNGSLAHYYFLSWFANSVLPARIGDVYRAYLLKKNRDIPVSLSLGVIFSERIFDLVITAALVVLSGTYYWEVLKNTSEGNYLFWGLLATAVVIFGFILVAFSLPHIIRFLPERIGTLVKSFQSGIFRSPRLLPVIILMTIIIWLTEALRLYFVFMALGIGSGFLMAVFISQASLILMAIPLSPAGLGLVELLMFKILASIGVSASLAGAATVSDRLISYWILVAAGLIVYIFSPRTR